MNPSQSDASFLFVNHFLRLLSIQKKARLKASLRGHQQAADIAHCGLRLPIYSWCTSPIRRYVDIIAQRLIVQICSKNVVKVADDSDQETKL